jgi:hypothetical protein
MMKWEQVREKYPNCWILFEALEAHSNNGKRIIDDISVVGDFGDSKDALNAYKERHRKDPSREYYYIHTKKEQLDIFERKWLGVRI